MANFNKFILVPNRKSMLLLAGLLLMAIVLLGFIVYPSLPQAKNIPEKSAPQSFLTESAQKVKNSCKNIADWRTCYGQQIGNVNKAIDFKDTLKVIEELKKIDSRTRDCHLIAHWVSLSEVEKAPEKWADVFNYVDQTTCNNGYVHGVMEGRSRVDPDFKLNQQVIIDTCKLIDEKTSKRLGQQSGGSDDACGHIMGHIMLAENNGEIPPTIKVCEGLDENLSKSCLQGLFMENVTRENLSIHLVAEKLKFTEEEANNLKEVCKQFDGDAGESCWRELSHIFTIISKLKPEKTYEYCYSGTNPGYDQECYFHAINLMVLAPQYSTTDLSNTCKPFLQDPEKLKSCISRTVSPLINSSVDFADKAINFCGFIPLDNNSKAFCYGRIGALLKPKAEPDKRAQLCKRAPKAFFKLCSAQQS